MTTIQFNQATVICNITSSHIFVVWLYLESYINRGSGAEQKMVSSNIYGAGSGGDGGKVFLGYVGKVVDKEVDGLTSAEGKKSV